MLQRKFLFLSCVCNFALVVSLEVSAGTIKVMTFNIKTSTFGIGFDQEESWDYAFGNSNDRRDRVISVINSSFPDLLGVQEMRSGQLDYMEDRLSDYAYYGVSRDTGTTNNSGERSGIFYKKSRFELLDRGEFWLSETPSAAGTTFFGDGGDTNNPRMATWVILHDRQMVQNYFFINTHWSLDAEARRLSGILMRDKIIELADGLPVIVTGDFNETAASRGGYAALVRRRTAGEFQLDNSYFESGAPLGKTFHGYNGGVNGSPIDFVFSSTSDFQAISGEIIHTTFDGLYPSDHYPVEVVLDVTPKIFGDYDEDNDVDGTDFLVWQRAFGTTSFDSPADGNSDGTVDVEDLDLWRDQFGTMVSSQTSAPWQAIPEPSTVLLLLGGEIALIVINGIRRRVR